MDQHFSLLVVLFLVGLVEVSRAREHYFRNWCGMRLVVPLCFQATVPMIAVGLIYWDLYHTGSAELTALTSRYFIPLSFIAAILAHVIYSWGAQKLTNPSTPIAELAFVSARIAQKRLDLAEQIESLPDGSELLQKAVDLSSHLTQKVKGSLRRKIARNGHSAHTILEVIDNVGVTIMKTVVKRSS
jgi:hypothetical protein